MEIISFIALILLSLVGYSGGVTSIAGKAYEPKPRLLDLGLILLIWGTAIYSRINMDFNKWLLILCWLIAGIFIGVLSGLLAKIFLKLPTQKEKVDKPLRKRGIWKRWKNFSMRMGSYQSRIMLSLFFFLLVTPFALITKIFKDPLKLKKKELFSFWDSKQKISKELEESRRQF